MATQRPLKEGSVRTYQEKVALGFPDILASEMDADLDTIYAAWTGGVATANLIDGSVTSAKLATGAVRGTPASGGVAREIAKTSIWAGDDLIDLSISTAKLADVAVTTAKLAASAVTVAKILPANAVRAFNAVAVPSSLNMTNAGWVSIVQVPLTTAGGWVLLIASHGGYCGVSAGGTQYNVMLGWGTDNATSPTVLAAEHIVRAPGSGALEIPLPAVLALTQPTAGTHAFYFLTALAGGAAYKTGSLPGTCYALELA